ncbi:preprotein translocase subunit SecE [Mycobacterium conspicuum]|uniref:Protein translocase subunit SecE n=1 Tax=Mycobacterium conspicuum TaxID=44010 RepID=A0A1X1T9Z8_9MYCO|nr:preprotein translocase subunit SecE [Mycobacterium conspicuum]ORV41404.1 preprotein translocase subunit SecE [Mycobacterium conspicuum]BBZ37471.1 protein translocase subunit SecE [Mycobacterium conspicuum]
MSDEGDVADDAASDGGQAEDSGGRTAVVTKSVTRPQRPTGKRSRQKATSDAGEASTEVGDGKEDSGGKKAGKAAGAKEAAKAGKAGTKPKKPKKAGARSANPFLFVYTYLKQVVAEMRKVIWPNRKQMLTYTSVVLAFLAFMVALVGLADLGLTKLVMLVFG